MDNKFESVYRIVIAFMIADKVVAEQEKLIIVDFLASKFWSQLSEEAKQLSYHKDKLGWNNFIIDAKIIYDNFSREEIFEILDYIANMIKSDWKIVSEETNLFEVLLTVWKIDKEIMIALWIRQSLWTNFFN